MPAQIFVANAQNQYRHLSMKVDVKNVENYSFGYLNIIFILNFQEYFAKVLEADNVQTIESNTTP